MRDYSDNEIEELFTGLRCGQAGPCYACGAGMEAVSRL